METRQELLDLPIVKRWPLDVRVRILPLHGDGRRGRVIGYKPPHIVAIRLDCGLKINLDERSLIRTSW